MLLRPEEPMQFPVREGRAVLKVDFGMQEVNHFHIGIGVYENRIIMELMNYKDLDCSGNVFYARGLQRKNFKRFHFAVKILHLPARIAYNTHLKIFPVYMHQICRRKSDIYLYLNHKLPRTKFDGKVVTTIHDLIPLKTEVESAAVRKTFLSYVQDAVSRSDTILTVSDYSRNDIAAYFHIPHNRIHVIPDGVDFAEFNNPVDRVQLESVREKYRLPEKFILYFGSARKHKNVGSILKAYARIPRALRTNVHLVITNGNEPLKKMAEELGIRPFVRFVGRVENADKAAFYQLADLKIFVSLYEGFGIPVLEAMAAGTPVVASNVSALPEVCGDAALLVDPADIDQIAEAMAKVLTDAGLRRDLINKGIKNAQKYTWARSAGKLHDLLVGECPGRADK